MKEFIIINILLLLPLLTLEISEAQSNILRVVDGVASQDIGTLTISQVAGGLRIHGNLRNLPPGPHGFHIHEVNNLFNSCIAAGPHLNLQGTNHGSLLSSTRHTGDMGNIDTNSRGMTTIDVTVPGLQFEGNVNLVQRSIVVHENADDFGQGGVPASLTTGNSGGRIACGLIFETRP
uniref:Superoxide dismutase [Cu-Zn] n=1 Tax=Parastrongyloides trichosuri TaxID=131310 RepID=A0A0N4ZFR6_PARTI